MPRICQHLPMNNTVVLDDNVGCIRVYAYWNCPCWNCPCFDCVAGIEFFDHNGRQVSSTFGSFPRGQFHDFVIQPGQKVVGMRCNATPNSALTAIGFVIAE